MYTSLEIDNRNSNKMHIIATRSPYSKITTTEILRDRDGIRFGSNLKHVASRTSIRKSCMEVNLLRQEKKKHDDITPVDEVDFGRKTGKYDFNCPLKGDGEGIYKMVPDLDLEGLIKLKYDIFTRNEYSIESIVPLTQKLIPYKHYPVVKALLLCLFDISTYYSYVKQDQHRIQCAKRAIHEYLKTNNYSGGPLTIDDSKLLSTKCYTEDCDIKGVLDKSKLVVKRLDKSLIDESRMYVRAIKHIIHKLTVRAPLCEIKAEKARWKRFMAHMHTAVERCGARRASILRRQRPPSKVDQLKKIKCRR